MNTAEYTWRCKDGRVLRLTDMTTEHLKSAAAMMRRKGFVTTNEFWCAVGSMSCLSGDMAQTTAENEIAAMCPCEALDAVEAEIERRARRDLLGKLHSYGPQGTPKPGQLASRCTCGASGFTPSKMRNRCEFCDGTYGGNPPTAEEVDAWNSDHTVTN